MEYQHIKIVSELYRSPELDEAYHEEYINQLWQSTCIFFEYILTNQDQLIIPIYIEHIGSINSIKSYFMSDDYHNFGLLLSNFYLYIISQYPIIPQHILNDTYLNNIYRSLYKVYDIIEIYINKDNQFRWGKCIRFSPLYRKLLNVDIESHNNNIEILIQQLKKKIIPSEEI